MYFRHSSCIFQKKDRRFNRSKFNSNFNNDSRLSNAKKEKFRKDFHSKSQPTAKRPWNPRNPSRSQEAIERTNSHANGRTTHLTPWAGRHLFRLHNRAGRRQSALSKKENAGPPAADESNLGNREKLQQSEVAGGAGRAALSGGNGDGQPESGGDDGRRHSLRNLGNGDEIHTRTGADKRDGQCVVHTPSPSGPRAALPPSLHGDVQCEHDSPPLTLFIFQPP